MTVHWMAVTISQGGTWPTQGVNPLDGSCARAQAEGSAGA